MILQQLIHVCSYYDSLFGERENKKKQLQAIIIILMGKLVLSNWISSVGSIDVSLKDYLFMFKTFLHITNPLVVWLRQI